MTQKLQFVLLKMLSSVRACNIFTCMYLSKVYVDDIEHVNRSSVLRPPKS